MRLHLSRRAAQDIEDIYLYGFINFGEAQADLYAQKISQTFDILCAHPDIGRLDTRVNPAVRCFSCESHVIFYDVQDDLILIVRILHRAMDFMRHLSG